LTTTTVSFLEKRRTQKKEALQAIKKDYKNNSLTLKAIEQIEKKYPKLYDGFFSQTSFDLVTKVKENLSSKKEKSSDYWQFTRRHF
jgi:hypothetical protein